MAELTYDDFKERISMQDLLIDAGYQLNRRDGLRYPTFVKIGSDGRRVHGDKFIISGNGSCCFQPPEHKNYNVISFIKEHPTMFAEYDGKMNLDKLVNLVCNRLLNNPIERKEGSYVPKDYKPKDFSLDDYDVKEFKVLDWESQKPFYPYFKSRGILNKTQRAFAGNFMLTTQKGGEKSYTNLSFPMRETKDLSKVVGLELRSRPDGNGKTKYKGMAPGSNAHEGMWIANLSEGRLDAAKDVYWFESAYDAMAFYQIEREQRLKIPNEAVRANQLNKLNNSVFVSTGGNPSLAQFESMILELPCATHHLCFDNDNAGRLYSINFALVADRRVFSSGINDGVLTVCDHTGGKDKMQQIKLDNFRYEDICSKLNINVNGAGAPRQDADELYIDYQPCNPNYKDYNDQLLEKPLSQSISEKAQESESEAEEEEEDIRPSFHR